MSNKPFSDLVRESKTYKDNYNYQYNQLSNEEGANKYLRKCAAKKYNKRLLVRFAEFFIL